VNAAQVRGRRTHTVAAAVAAAVAEAVVAVAVAEAVVAVAVAAVAVVAVAVVTVVVVAAAVVAVAVVAAAAAAAAVATALAPAGPPRPRLTSPRAAISSVGHLKCRTAAPQPEHIRPTTNPSVKMMAMPPNSAMMPERKTESFPLRQKDRTKEGRSLSPLPGVRQGGEGHRALEGKWGWRGVFWRAVAVPPLDVACARRLCHWAAQGALLGPHPCKKERKKERLEKLLRVGYEPTPPR
jgi:hypothetical protein